MHLSWRLATVTLVALLAAPATAQAAEPIVTEHHRVLNAAQIVLVLLAALGLCHFVRRKLKWPALVGEIAVGLLLGPTVFGRVWPEGFETIFPHDPIQHTLLDGFAFWGVVFLLLSAGLEIRTSAALKRRRSALVIGIMGVLIPWALGFVLTLAYVELAGYTPPGSPTTFAAFLGITMAISAMVIITRLLHELELTGTHLGQTILCAYAVNDVLAWVIFSAIFQVATHGQMSVSLMVLQAALVFAGTLVALQFGPRLMDRVFSFLNDKGGEAFVLKGVFLFAVAGGVITHGVGLTFFYGVFLAGIVVSENRAVTEHVHHLLTKMAQQIMVPVYFIYIGLSVDFGSNFDFGHVVFISAASIALKFVGAWVSAMMSTRPRYEWTPIGIAFTPSGVTGIVLASVALEANIIDESIVVAIVASAIISTMVAGPWLRHSVEGLMRKIMRRTAPMISNAIVRDPLSVHQLAGEDREAALTRLCRIAAASAGVAPSWKSLMDMVSEWQGTVEREFAHAVGWVHARDNGIHRPVVVIGWSSTGITWRDAEDRPVKLVVLLLLPKKSPRINLVLQRKLAHAIHQLGEQGIHSVHSLGDATQLVEQVFDSVDAEQEE